jgi:DNA-binding Lrp family transcriptional regulator
MQISGAYPVVDAGLSGNSLDSCGKSVQIWRVPNLPTSRMEPIDARIVAAVQADPRASYAQLATTVGVSESTVMRRLQRLRSSGEFIVTGTIDAQRCGLGQPVLVQLRTEPGSTVRVAQTVAARTDVRFLAIVTGRTNIVCQLMVRDRHHLATTLLHELSRIDGITSISTAAVLRTYKTRDEWSQVLLPGPPPTAEPQSKPGAGLKAPKMDHLDMALINALGEDGRRSYVDLANELGLSESAVARRLSLLLAGKRLSLVALVNPLALGFEVEVFLGLRVDLGAAETVATMLSRRSEIRYVSVTAGYSDIACEAVLRDNDALHEFMTTTLGNIRGIRDVAIDLELQTLKRSFRNLNFHTGADSPAVDWSGADTRDLAELAPDPERPAGSRP